MEIAPAVQNNQEVEVSLMWESTTWLKSTALGFQGRRYHLDRDFPSSGSGQPNGASRREVFSVYGRDLDSGPARWKLKKAIRALNETPEELKPENHPDETYMGRTDKGFDSLG